LRTWAVPRMRFRPGPAPRPTCSATLTCSPWLVRNRCRVRSQRHGNEETIYGRTDHRGAEGGRGRGQGGRTVPQARDLGGHLLQLEGEVRRYDRLGRPAPEGTGAREQQAQEAVG